MKAAIANVVYDIIEHKLKRGDQTITRLQLVSPGRQAQRTYEREQGIASSRQRRHSKSHRVRRDCEC